MLPQPPLPKVPLSLVLATAALLGYLSWIPFLGFASFLIACVMFPQPPLLKGREQWVRGWLIKTLYRYSSFKVVYQDGHQKFTRKTAAVGELHTRCVKQMHLVKCLHPILRLSLLLLSPLSLSPLPSPQVLEVRMV